MRAAPAVQIGELRGRQPVRIGTLDLRLCERRPVTVEFLHDAGREKMQHFTGPFGDEAEDIVMPRHHKLRQRKGFLPAGKIHQVAQERRFGLTFGKAERSLDGAMETIPTRQGRVIGNLLHAKIDHTGRLNRLTGIGIAPQPRSGYLRQGVIGGRREMNGVSHALSPRRKSGQTCLVAGQQISDLRDRLTT